MADPDYQQWDSIGISCRRAAISICLKFLNCKMHGCPQAKNQDLKMEASQLEEERLNAEEDNLK